MIPLKPLSIDGLYRLSSGMECECVYLSREKLEIIESTGDERADDSALKDEKEGKEEVEEKEEEGEKEGKEEEGGFSVEQRSRHFYDHSLAPRAGYHDRRH